MYKVITKPLRSHGNEPDMSDELRVGLFEHQLALGQFLEDEERALMGKVSDDVSRVGFVVLLAALELVIGDRDPIRRVKDRFKRPIERIGCDFNLPLREGGPTPLKP